MCAHDWELWRTNFTAGTYTYRCLLCWDEEDRAVPYTPPSQTVSRVGTRKPSRKTLREGATA